MGYVAGLQFNASDFFSAQKSVDMSHENCSANQVFAEFLRGMYQFCTG